jgi:hypothetical protein
MKVILKIACFMMLMILSCHKTAFADDSQNFLFSVGIRQAFWASEDDSIHYDANFHRLVDFSYTLKDRFFISVFLSQNQQSDLKKIDKVEQIADRLGLNIGFKKLSVTTELGRISGHTNPTSKLAYSDTGEFAGKYQLYGVFYNPDEIGWKFGGLYIERDKPELFRYAEGSCKTVSTHCYFTDRKVHETMALVAAHFDNGPESGFLSSFESGYTNYPYIAETIGIGYGRVMPSIETVKGVSAATGVPLDRKPIQGIALYSIGEIGWLWCYKTKTITGFTALGAYLRFNSTIPISSSQGLGTFNEAYDYGPFLKLGVIW